VGAVLVGNLLLTLLAFRSGGRLVLLNLTDSLQILLKVDEMTLIFGLVFSIMWILSGIFSFEYMKHEGRNESYYQFFLIAVGMLMGLGMAGNYMTLYLFFEGMTLLTFPLVLHSRTRESIAAGMKYLVYSIFGASLALIGFFFASQYCTTMEFTAGGTLDMTKVAGHEGLLLAVFFLVIVGFGAKAGMFPLHGWLPTAHPVAPAPASAVLSGVITKAGVLAIIRVVYYLAGTEFLRGTWVQYAWMTLTLITVFMGSMLAYKEKILKKRLAYSTVSQVSYILFGLSTMTTMGVTGALLHVVCHSIVKDLLFLCAGAIIYKTHCTKVEELTGIGKRMPVVMWCFTIASLALVGVPPMIGFISKWYLAIGSLESGCGAFTWIGPAVLLTSALLTAGYLLTISVKAFLPGADFDYSTVEKCEPNAFMLVPLILLAVATVLTGMFPTAFIQFFTNLAGTLI
jgi:multicomponent Na+:H+ antiporter subunit D